jgi:DNA mismatch repair protein MSH6
MEYILKGVTKEYYKKFDSHYNVWKTVIQCLSIIDCLFSLHKSSSHSNYTTCRPKFVISKNDEHPIFEIKNMVHPVMMNNMNDTFIPNDVKLGGNDPSSIIITGPNMGGKSKF